MFDQATQNGLNSAHNARVGTIIKNLDSVVIPRYLGHLETAKQLLKNYLAELGEVESRLQKVDSGTRLALGEPDLHAKKVALEETIRKLEAHQKSTLLRLNG